MEHTLESIESLVRPGDISAEAVGRRLRAAREITGMSQKDFAEMAGLNIKTYNSMEKRGAPSREVMVIFRRRFGVDMNFIIHGDYAQLSLDLQRRLVNALARQPIEPARKQPPD